MTKPSNPGAHTSGAGPRGTGPPPEARGRVTDYEALKRALSELALVLALIPELGHWSAADKGDLIRIIQAKAGADESKYLRSMQRHHRLRAEMIRLGSGNA